MKDKEKKISVKVDKDGKAYDMDAGDVRRPFEVGHRVEALYGDKWYPGVIAAVSRYF